MKPAIKSRPDSTNHHHSISNTLTNNVHTPLRRHNPSLTAEEAVILRALAGGKTDKQVCAELRLPSGVFYRLLRDLHQKTGVTDRLSLLVWALRRMESGERRTELRDSGLRP
ncbi:MAG: helix-turn-helix transcriptional regulator [Candidatus Acidiferrales bacterium]